MRTLGGGRVASAGRSGANSVVRWGRGVDVRKRSRALVEVLVSLDDGMGERAGDGLLVGTREDRNLFAEAERKGVEPSWPGAGRDLYGVLLKLMVGWMRQECESDRRVDGGFSTRGYICVRVCVGTMR